MKKFFALVIGLFLAVSSVYAQSVCLLNPNTIPSIRIYDLGNLNVPYQQIVSITQAQYNSSLNAQNYVTAGILRIVQCSTFTPTPTNTGTSTPTATATNTPTGTLTPSATPTSTPTNTATATPTNTGTPTPIGTIVAVYAPAGNVTNLSSALATSGNNPFYNNYWGFGTSTYDENPANLGPSGEFVNAHGIFFANQYADGGAQLGINPYPNDEVSLYSDTDITLYSSGSLSITGTTIPINGTVNFKSSVQMQLTPTFSGSVTLNINPSGTATPSIFVYVNGAVLRHTP
jgi:hypothetical protein